jgi:hypothetical protein
MSVENMSSDIGDETREWITFFSDNHRYMKFMFKYRWYAYIKACREKKSSRWWDMYLH